MPYDRAKQMLKLQHQRMANGNCRACGNKLDTTSLSFCSVCLFKKRNRHRELRGYKRLVGSKHKYLQPTKSKVAMALLA